MASLEERDRAALWHPATHFGDLERLPPVAFAGASGPWLVTPTGQKIFDGISSWWTSLHGHGHEAIVRAIADQAARLDHVMFAGFTHEPGVVLAEQLLASAPPGFGKVFYADCGSAGVEVAQKLSFQSRLQTGEPERGRFATLARGYHGETLGALSLCGYELYRKMFDPLLSDVLTLPAPPGTTHLHEDLVSDAGADHTETHEAVRLLHAHAHELTALILEPVIQCAGKMAMPGVGFYRAIIDTAQSLGIHVIADEIAVGFGRTGRMFASDWLGRTPDLMVLSKGLSGGTLPLCAVLVRAGFEDAFQGPPSRSFLHSHTFTGNPIACRAAIASLELLDPPALEARLSPAVRHLGELAKTLVATSPYVAGARQAGMVVAFDLDLEATVGPKTERPGLELRRAALERGLLLRPLGDTVYWMPPLNATESEREFLAEATQAAIAAVFDPRPSDGRTR